MKLIDADELIAQLPDDLPYKGSVRRVLMQAQELCVFKCPHCGEIYTCTNEKSKHAMLFALWTLYYYC